MIPHRYAEAAALVPLLHMRPGPTVVRVAGPLSALIASEALRWRDTTEVWADQPLPIKDSRIQTVQPNHTTAFDAVLLSPDMNPEPFMALLKRGGILQCATTVADKLAPLRVQVKALTGGAVPYREYTPEPIWFVIGSVGSMPRRVRRPPDGAKRVTERFLPALFSFGKDEIPFVFGPGEKS
jgi:hypothetical protein